MRPFLTALAILAPLAAEAGCLSIGPGAEFCGQSDWRFENYVEEGVLHVASDGVSVYHLHRLREVGQDGVDAEVVFEQHAANFTIEYGGDAYAEVQGSQGERHDRRTLEYEFTVKEWEDGNRTRLTFLIDGNWGYSFVTSGQPPVDRAQLNARHEQALAAFRLTGAPE